MENNATIILQIRSDGVIYVQPGLTVGKLLALTQALENMALNLPVSTATPEPTLSDVSAS